MKEISVGQRLREMRTTAGPIPSFTGKEKRAEHQHSKPNRKSDIAPQVSALCSNWHKACKFPSLTFLPQIMEAKSWFTKNTANAPAFHLIMV